MLLAKVAMKPIHMFFLACASIAALILYVAAVALPQPPLASSLFGREAVTVTQSGIETRQAKRSALPVIDVRDSSGIEHMLHGFRWMSESAGNDVVAAYPVGATVEVPRWQGKLWRALSGVRDWILLIISLFASVALLFNLRMLWKLRNI